MTTICYLPGQTTPEHERWYINIDAVDCDFLHNQRDGASGALTVRAIFTDEVPNETPPRCRACSDGVVLESPASLLAMDLLTLFGLCAVSLMLACYALEDRSHWFVLAFAGSCVLGSVYGFLQGAWPFGIVEAVWFLIALRRWWLARRSFDTEVRTPIS